MKKLEEVYPIKGRINVVQTDNGSEFMGYFDKYLKIQKIRHVLIYPRCPKINGYIERSNRTLQEEFLDWKPYLLVEDDIDKLNDEMMEYLVWYNTKRVHKGLKNRSPIDYLLQLLPKSHMYVTHT